MDSIYVSVVVAFLFVAALFLMTLTQSDDDEELIISNRLLMRLTLAVFVVTYITQEFVIKSSSITKGMFGKAAPKIDTKW